MQPPPDLPELLHVVGVQYRPGIQQGDLDMRVLQAFQPSHHQAMHFVHMPEQDLQHDKQQEPVPSMQAGEEPDPSLQVAEDEPEPHLQLAEDEPEPHLQLAEDEPEPHLQLAEEEPGPSLQLAEEEPEPHLQLAEEEPGPSLQLAEEEQEPVLPLQPKDQLQVGEEQTHGLHVHQIIQPARLEETSLQRSTSLNNKQSVKIVSVNQAKLALKYL